MSKRMKAVVAADLHLGYRMYGLKQREQDFYDSCRRVFGLAKDEGADAVIMAGDVFDTGRPPAAAVACLGQCVSKFVGDTGSSRAVYAVEGNHDRVGNGDWLKVCGITQACSQPCQCVGGVDYLRPKELLEALDALAVQCEDRGYGIPVLVMHCGFEDMGDPFAGDLPTRAVMPYLKRIGCHTVCVGHIHKTMVHEEVFDGHRTVFLQPGSIETCSLNEERTKHVFVVEFDETSSSYREVGIPVRRFEDVRIDDQDGLKAFLAEPDLRFEDAMTAVRVRTSVDGAVAAVEQRLAGRLFRVMAYSDKLASEDFDRSSQLVSLESVIGEYFDPGSDVYELLREVLRTPEATAEIA